MAYVFTASKASSIRLACKANFLDDKKVSLVTVSSNIIHIYQDHSLDVSHEITCYGRISSITPFQYYDSKLDQLFITTEDHKYFTLSYTNGQIITSTTGDISSIGLSTPEMGHRVFASELYLVLYLYNGIISVIPIHQGPNPKKRAADGNRIIGIPQQLRLDEIKVHGIARIKSGSGAQSFAILYRDVNLMTHLKTYELHQKKNDIVLQKGALTMSQLEHGTNLIVPLGEGGVCCIGESHLYLKRMDAEQVDYPIATPTLFNSITQIDSREWVLGDDYGLLYSLTFPQSAPVLRQISPSKISDTPAQSISIPHVLIALENEIFLGSHYGDSQLLGYPSLEVLAHKTNIGPIQDLLVEPPLGAGGSSSLITASGAYKDGAMRIVKYGVGMAELAELEINNVRGLWGVEELAIIAIGFLNSFIVLRVSVDGEIDQVESGDDELVYACCIDKKLVLVKQNGITLSDGGTSLYEHKMSSVTAAKSFQDSLYIVNDGALESWSLENDNFKLKQSKRFDQEISAFEISLDSIIVCFWNSEKLWLGHTNLEEVSTMSHGSTVTAHSIVLQKLSSMEAASLLIAMKDGTLLSYSFDTQSKAITNRKESTVGTTPISLHMFTTRHGPHVFAVCDRPTIIHSSRGKLVFSTFSNSSCTYFTSFNSQALQSSMIVATDSGLRFGGIDSIQKLQFSAAPLGELCRRLVKTAGIIGALTMRMEVEQVTGNETQRSFLKLFDSQTFDKLDEYELQGNEMCQSLCIIHVDGGECLAVGTSFADDERDECVRGRIMIFGIHKNEHKLWMMSQVEVPGSVYCLGSVGSQLVAGVNSFVRLFTVSSDSFKEVHKFRSSTYAITMATLGDTVLVGDLMKSVTYLRVRDGLLKEVARDYVPTWMTAVQFCDEKTFIGAEAEGNLILLTEDDSLLPENRMRLSRIGQFRYGEMINRLVPGNFIVPEDTSIVQPHTLFGTVDGSIGCIGTIHGDYVNLLLQLQTKIGSCRQSVGGLSHAEYRGYKCSGTRDLEPLRFVDGDLIEEYLDLNESQKESVCDGLDKTPVEIEKIVENLARLR